MKKTISLILLIVQSLIVIACLTLIVLYFMGNKGLLNIIMLLVSGDLLILGFNNLLLVKNKKYALIYFVVGILMLISVVLKMVGVQI